MQLEEIKASKTKEQILQAACRLVHRQGFNHTSVEDILRESGVGKGNFYYHFKSKDDLGYAMLDRLELWISRQVGEQIFRQSDDPIGEIFDLFDFIVATQREAKCVGGCPLGNFALEMSDIHDGFRRRIAGILDSYRGHIADALTRARGTGQLAQNVHSDRLAGFIFAQIEGAILVAKVRKDVTLLEQCLDELKKHVRMYVV